MKASLIFLSLLTVGVLSKAQSVLPVNDEDQHRFIEGIYLSFEDFRNNNPIKPSQIKTDLDINDPKFYNQLKKKEMITISANDSVFQITPSHLWGYSDGKDVYLNSLLLGVDFNLIMVSMTADPWAKVDIMGTLSCVYSVIDITTRNRYGIPTSSDVPGYHILNMKDGKLYNGNMKALKKLIADDPDLLEEQRQSREDKDTKFFTFLKKYNARHPIEFY